MARFWFNGLQRGGPGGTGEAAPTSATEDIPLPIGGLRVNENESGSVAVGADLAGADYERLLVTVRPSEAEAGGTAAQPGEARILTVPQDEAQTVELQYLGGGGPVPDTRDIPITPSQGQGIYFLPNAFYNSLPFSTAITIPQTPHGGAFDSLVLTLRVSDYTQGSTWGADQEVTVPGDGTEVALDAGYRLAGGGGNITATASDIITLRYDPDLERLHVEIDMPSGGGSGTEQVPQIGIRSITGHFTTTLPDTAQATQATLTYDTANDRLDYAVPDVNGTSGPWLDILSVQTVRSITAEHTLIRNTVEFTGTQPDGELRVAEGDDDAIDIGEDSAGEDYQRLLVTIRRSDRDEGADTLSPHAPQILSLLPDTERSFGLDYVQRRSIESGIGLAGVDTSRQIQSSVQQIRTIDFDPLPSDATSAGWLRTVVALEVTTYSASGGAGTITISNSVVNIELDSGDTDTTNLSYLTRPGAGNYVPAITPLVVAFDGSTVTLTMQAAAADQADPPGDTYDGLARYRVLSVFQGYSAARAGDTATAQGTLEYNTTDDTLEYAVPAVADDFVAPYFDIVSVQTVRELSTLAESDIAGLLSDPRLAGQTLSFGVRGSSTRTSITLPDNTLTSQEIAALLNGQGRLEESSLDVAAQNKLNRPTGHHLEAVPLSLENPNSGNIRRINPGETYHSSLGTTDWESITVRVIHSRITGDGDVHGLTSGVNYYLVRTQSTPFQVPYIRDSDSGTYAVSAFVEYDSANDRLVAHLGTPQDARANHGPALEVTALFGHRDAAGTSGGLDQGEVRQEITTLTEPFALIANTDEVPAAKLPDASATQAGLMSSADFSKLDAIEDNATADQTGAEIKAAYEGEANTNAFTDEEKTKLDGIEEGAQRDLTAGQVKTLYEANSDTNAFTDAEKTKLDGIEDNATADQTGAEIRASLTAELGSATWEQGGGSGSGTPGAAGAGFEYRFTRVADGVSVGSGNRPSATLTYGTQEAFVVGSTAYVWTANAPTLTEANPVLWRTERPITGSPSSGDDLGSIQWSTPIVVGRRGADGEDGTGGTVPEASTEQRGTVELASATEARAGTSTILAITPSGLSSAIGAIDPCVAPYFLRSATLPATPTGTNQATGTPPASRSSDGNTWQRDPTLATGTDQLWASLGTLHQQRTGAYRIDFCAPFRIADTDARNDLTGAEIVALLDAQLGGATWQSGGGAVADASATARGIVELATLTEVATGTDTERAVTPAGLSSRLGGLDLAAASYFIRSATAPTGPLDSVRLAADFPDTRNSWALDPTSLSGTDQLWSSLAIRTETRDGQWRFDFGPVHRVAETDATDDQTGGEIATLLDTELGGATWRQGGGAASPPGATETVVGVVEIANPSEARLGASNTLAVSPASLNAAISALDPVARIFYLRNDSATAPATPATRTSNAGSTFTTPTGWQTTATAGTGSRLWATVCIVIEEQSSRWSFSYSAPFLLGDPNARVVSIDQRLVYARSDAAPSNAGSSYSYAVGSTEVPAASVTGTPETFSAANISLGGVPWYLDLGDATGTDPIYTRHVNTTDFDGIPTVVSFGPATRYADPDRVAPNASTTQAGVVELATGPEARIGTDEGRALTPDALTSSLRALDPCVAPYFIRSASQPFISPGTGDESDSAFAETFTHIDSGGNDVVWSLNAADATGTGQLWASLATRVRVRDGVYNFIYCDPFPIAETDANADGITTAQANALIEAFARAGSTAPIPISRLAEDSLTEAEWTRLLPDDTNARRIIQGAHLGTRIIGMSPLGNRVRLALNPAPPNYNTSASDSLIPSIAGSTDVGKFVRLRADGNGYELADVPAGGFQLTEIFSGNLDVTAARQWVDTGAAGWDTYDWLRVNVARVGTSAVDEDGEYRDIRVSALLALDASAAGGALSNSELNRNYLGVNRGTLAFRFGRTSGNSLLFTTDSTNFDAVPLTVFAYNEGDVAPNGVRFTDQTLTEEQQAQARQNIDIDDAVRHSEQTLTADQQSQAQENIGGPFATSSESTARATIPTTGGFETQRDFAYAFSSLSFTGISTGNPSTAATTPNELIFDPPLSTTVAGSYLNLEIGFDGTGSGQVFVGRRTGATGVTWTRDLDPTSDDTLYSIDASVAQTLTARVHTSASIVVGSDNYTWRILVGSNSPTASTGGVTFTGTISNPTGRTAFPSAWQSVFDNGPNGYPLPYRLNSTTRFTSRIAVSLDRPINIHDASLVRLDIDPSSFGSYGYRRGYPEIVFSTDKLWRHRTTTTDLTNVVYDSSNALYVDTSVDTMGGWTFGGGDQWLDRSIAIQWIQADPDEPEITHISVVASVALEGFSRGRINNIHVL